MNRYIDADELLAEIDRQEIGYNIDGKHTAEYDTCKKIIDIINSLQREQPKLPGYDKALLEVKRKVDELYEETSIGLCEYDSGLYNGIAETCMKLRGFIKARLDSDEQPDDVVVVARAFLDALSKTPYNNKPITDAQIIVKQLLIFLEKPSKYNPDAILEQPEVDLEEEIEKCLKQYNMLAMGEKDFTDIARHFYELGFNARKED